MATITELREDFLYLGIVELAVLIGVSANAVYLGDFHGAFFYFLLFVGVIILERCIFTALIIPKQKGIREIFEKIMVEKKAAKRKISFLLFLLIILSSWGIVSYITKIYLDSRDYVKILTLVTPWYIAIYGAWLGYLIYMKNRYTKLVIALLSKKKMKTGKIAFLYHGDKYITMVPVSAIDDEKLKKEIAIHNEDFRYGNFNILVEKLGNLKLAVMTSGGDGKLRVNMKGALRAIKISFPKKFEEGNYNDAEVQEIENIIRRYLFL